MPRVWLKLLKDLPAFLDEKLKQGLVWTFGIFEGSLHLSNAGFDELDARSILTCSDQGRSPLCKLGWRGGLLPQDFCNRAI